MFVSAVIGLWLVFVVQAVNAPVLLDDWFVLRYWRDHPYGWGALWDYGRHNYFHYNPRMGDLFLAIIDGSRAVHLIASPLVQLAATATTFVIAFGRWPRRTLRDLQLLLFIQVTIWLVIPIPGIIYFYRPIATNYLWAFTVTLALFVPYRLALAGAPAAASRSWQVLVMLVLGWVAGMCNEHTGPTAMVAMAGFVMIAWRRRQLRAWMVGGLVGLYIGYPMLIFAPGQTIRYAGLALRDTPSKLLADRGIAGCLEILADFVYESRLGIVLFLAAVVRYVVTVRRGPRLARETAIAAATLAAASSAIVVTLFVSPMTTDRVLFASGVLLVAALAVCVEHLFAERGVRRLVVGACVLLFGFHVVRFVHTYAAVKAENDARIAILRATTPGTGARVPRYAHERRSRWHLGDDFQIYPWLGDYVGTELFDLASVEVDGLPARPAVRYRVARTYDPPLDGAKPPRFRDIPTYRQWLRDPASRFEVASQLADLDGHCLARFRIGVLGLPFDDPRHRSIVAVEWTPAGFAYVEGAPYDDARGHFIRLRPESMPAHVEAAYVIGCGETQRVELVTDAGVGPLLPVDERVCRGVFTAILCEPDRCWVAGWY